MRYHARFTNYIVPQDFPVYVEFVRKGHHPENHVHDHNFTEVVLILSGEGEYLLEKSRKKITAGDLLIVPPGLSHAYERVETLELVNLTYKTEELYIPLLDAYELPLFELFFPPDRRQMESDFYLAPILHLPEDEIALVSEKLHNLQDLLRLSHSGSCFKALGLFIEIVGFLAGKGNKNIMPHLDFPGRAAVLQMIQKNFNREISLTDLASAAHMSERTFLRHFKKATGMSPMEYLNECRLQRGAKLLYDNTLSIGEIAIMCGFCDSSHFSRSFQKRYAVSPRSYRQQKLQNNP